MSNDGTRHSGPDPSDPHSDPSAATGGWPGQPDPEMTQRRQPGPHAVRGSASVPVPRSAPPAPDRPAYPPGTYPTGDVRAAGTAHVPDGTLLPSHHLPALPRPTPRVYGSPSAPPAPAPYGPPPVPAAAPPGYGPPGFGQPGPYEGSPPSWGGHADQGYPPVGYQGAPGPGFPGSGAPGGWPGGVGPGPRYGPPGHDTGAGPDEQAPPSRPDGTGSHTGLLIAVGAVVLLAVVAMIAFMWPDRSAAPQFAVGTCVRNSGETPVAAECTTAGAFQVVAQVNNKSDCADQTQPYIELGTGRARVLCLTPAGAANPATSPSGSTSSSPVPGTT